MANSINVTDELQKILDEYEDDVEKTAAAEIQNVAKKTADELKNTSPRKTGAYAKGWAVQKESGTGIADYTVHNKTKPQLTHLLENGHIIRNKKGTYGRVAGIAHIAPAAEKAERELMERLESKL